ncbi:MAG: CHAT domain-containing protein [Caldilineaceae bacterium]
MNIAYQNFDVAIEQNEEGYFVHVREAPAGEAVEPFYLSISAQEQAIFTQALAAQADQAESNAAGAAELEAVGKKLFTALFPPPILGLLQSSYRMAYEQRARLRIRLQLTNVPELTSLPWEYLYDPSRNEFLALVLHSPLVRYTQLLHHVLPFKVKPPLRMLVIIASPEGYPPINRERQWFTLLDTLDYLALEGHLLIERLMKPTLLDLQRRLRQGDCHLLHFIGYGTTEPFTRDGVLAFEDEMGRARLINGEHLGALLRDHFPLRLVTLCAADAERTSSDNPFIQTAQSLIRRGMPAVVALRSALHEERMVQFLNTFYPAIVNYTPLDIAITEVRRTLQSGAQDHSWGTPVLITRIPDGQLFTTK